MPNLRQPLSSIRVLDLSRVRSGPTAVRQLADWGADVIKIEPPGDADLFGDHRGSSDFQNLQRNKRSCTLNLKTPEGVAIFKRLAESADVVVENFRPDVKTRLGIAYVDLQAVNPRLVYASISGFGEDGPYRDRPGFDQIAQGMGGLMSITGLPGQGPVRAGIPIADLSAGLLCAQGILLALLDREHTGEGQWVTTSLLQAQVFMLDFQATRWLDDRVIPEQAGNSHPTYSLTGVFKTSDGWINIAASNQAMWKALCRVFEEDVEPQAAQALLANPLFATAELRLTHRDAVNEAVTGLLQARSCEYWLERLNDAGVPCGPINSVDQVFADPQVRHLGMVEEIASPYFEPLRVVGQAFQLSRADSRVRLRPPDHGEHTDDVLSSLGYDAAAIASLRARGIV